MAKARLAFHSLSFQSFAQELSRELWCAERGLAVGKTSSNSNSNFREFTPSACRAPFGVSDKFPWPSIAMQQVHVRRGRICESLLTCPSRGQARVEGQGLRALRLRSAAAHVVILRPPWRVANRISPSFPRRLCDPTVESRAARRCAWRFGARDWRPRVTGSVGRAHRARRGALLACERPLSKSFHEVGHEVGHE